MDRILDLDLDFFAQPVLHWRGPDHGRPADGPHYKIASEADVRKFLEDRCNLDATRKLRGREEVEHIEAFSTWRRWLEEEKLTAPFEVVHVDAHADLGLGDSGYVYLMTELLSLPPQARSHPRIGAEALSSSNYLAFALAQRWISALTYVFPTDKSTTPIATSPSGYSFESIIRQTDIAVAALEGAQTVRTDLMPLLFRDEDTQSGILELRCIRPNDEDALVCGASLTPLSVEPSVPFSCVPDDVFTMAGFTHIFLAQSPLFCPPSTDSLLPVIREYFNPT